MKRPRPPAYIFVSPASFPALKEAQKLLPQPPATTLAFPRSVLDALSAVDVAGRAILTISASESKHLKLATTLAARLKTQIKAGLVKVIVVSSIEHPDLPKLLKKHGCEELLSPELTDKAFKLKWTRLMAVVELAWAKSSQGRAEADEEKKEASAQHSRDARDKVKKNTVKAVASLKIADDCWIVRGKAFKFVADIWIVRVHGPSPSTGRWIALKEKNNAWCWAPRDPVKNAFVSEGAWTFYGKQPENKDKTWIFVGEKPRLVYTQQGKEICARFESVEDGMLKVARNSRAALKKSALIDSSYEQDLKVKRAPTQHGGEDSPMRTKASGASFTSGTSAMTGKAADATQAVPDLGGANLDFGQGETVDLDGETDLAIGPPAPPFADGKFGTKVVVDIESLSFFEEIADELGPKPEMFHRVSDRKECLALIRESAHLRAPAIIWTRGQKYRKSTQVTHFAKADGALGIQLPAGTDWSALMQALAEVQAEEIFVNANLGRTAIFFKQIVNQLRPSGASLEVSCPEKIYEVQRRRHLRTLLKFSDTAQASIAVDGKAGTVWKLLDISAGGVCVSRASAPQGFADKLTRGTRIMSISFKIYGHEIECDARVVWVRRKKGQGATEDLKMGLQFDHITHADREGIRLYVMEENYAYLKNNMARSSDD